MSTFTRITKDAWDTAVVESGKGSLLMTSAWEGMILQGLPYVSFEHYRYRDTHAIRMARIGGRLTAVPFSDGSDVVSLGDTPADALELERDAMERFGGKVRFRLNERFVPLDERPARSTGSEYVVPLDRAIMPRVRKTLRHILERPLAGHIEQVRGGRDIARAYRLYLAHMRSVSNLAMPRHLFVSLANDPRADLWVWRKGERIEAMALFLHTKTEALYALSAASRVGLFAHAPHHIVHAALGHYQKAGMKCASLGGTRKDSALETFKRGWRGNEYSVYELGAGGAHGAARTSPVRSLARLVPLSLYSRVSFFAGKYLL